MKKLNKQIIIKNQVYDNLKKMKNKDKEKNKNKK